MFTLGARLPGIINRGWDTQGLATSLLEQVYLSWPDPWDSSSYLEFLATKLVLQPSSPTYLSAGVLPRLLLEVSLSSTSQRRPDPLGTDLHWTWAPATAASPRVTSWPKGVWYQYMSAQPHPAQLLDIRRVGNSNTLTKIQFSNRFMRDETESTRLEDVVGTSYQHPCSDPKLLSINSPRKESPPCSSWVTGSQAELNPFSVAPGSINLLHHTTRILFCVLCTFKFSYNFSIFTNLVLKL